MWWTALPALFLLSSTVNCRRGRDESLGAWPSPTLKTKGQIWPLPQIVTKTNNKTWSLDLTAFELRTEKDCDIITEAIKRYKTRLCLAKDSSRSNTEDALKTLTISFERDCPEEEPQLGLDESYKIDVTTENAVIKATEVWGALRGLESFSQMVYYDRNDGCKIDSAIVKDFPRFPHRGVLLDTSRHFLSLNSIRASIDLMSQNKFNVFHWHIVDETSFPYGSKVLPRFSAGAFTPDHIYSLSDIKEIIAYARLRGVRVVPEFDTPGHTKSWGYGYTEFVTRCFTKDGKEEYDRSLLDPTQEDTWDILLGLFQEVFQVFPDDYVHLGGDETEYWIPYCWENNKNVTDFMKIYGLNSAKDLEEWYFDKLLTMLNNIRGQKKKKFLVWQEVLDMGIEVEGAIAHVWKGSTRVQQMAEMKEVTGKGHYALLSSCWYLDHIATAADWLDYYTCDPQGFTATATQKNLVLGGEAALWGEWVDDSNVVSRLWPRASAVAERLWSAAEATQDASAAWPRLYEMQCRMASRGYPVQPGNGPGFCDFEYRSELPV